MKIHQTHLINFEQIPIMIYPDYEMKFSNKNNLCQNNYKPPYKNHHIYHRNYPMNSIIYLNKFVQLMMKEELIRKILGKLFHA
jgi:predicted amidophosphoribosyltransferase